MSVFERLLAANGGRLGGFFDVFAWRHSGEVRFDEVKVRPNRIGTSQCKFLETALRFHPVEQLSLAGFPSNRGDFLIADSCNFAGSSDYRPGTLQSPIAKNV
jgi:hypothetical protein